jgi:hypothetical protein
VLRAGGPRRAGGPVLTADPAPPKRRLLRRLFRAAGPRGAADGQTLGDVVSGLGDRSFGWLIIIFSLVNLLPLPPGSTVLTGIPLVLVTAQMALGLRQIWLPGFINRVAVSRKNFQRRVLRLRPIIRPIERITRARHEYIFAPGPEQALGVFLLCVAIALLLPIPLSAYLPAIALFVSGVGLVERDGLVTLIGVVIGVVAITVTVVMAGLIFFGAKALAG